MTLVEYKKYSAIMAQLVPDLTDFLRKTLKMKDVGKFLLLLITISLGKECVSETIVNTSIGRIAGLSNRINLLGKQYTVTKFLGIPYGEDTSGSNRFKKPVPKAPFNETFYAYTPSMPCMQAILRGDPYNRTEDCLRLNIFVPRDFQSASATDKLPVMVWLHGGAFVQGSAKGYNSEVLASFGDVIIVILDFRLAEFGFLNVGDDRAKGNMALWDQHLAFKWVKSNIKEFLGDPDNITIFGESSGATMVGLHTLYAGNKGLFRRVIIESGSAFAFWALRPPNLGTLFHLSGCDKGKVDPVDCLRNLSALDFTNILSLPEIGLTGCCSNSPSIDGEFLVENPHDIAFGNNSISAEARQFFRSLDILTGVNNGDGAEFILVVWLLRLRQFDLNNLAVKKSDFSGPIPSWVISDVIRPKSNESDNTLTKAIEFEYIDWSDPDNIATLRNNLMKISSDVGFSVPALETMEAHTIHPGSGTSYFYEFLAEPPSRIVPTPLWFHGASHGDEIQYVFGSPFLNVSFAEIFHFVPTTRNGTVTKADENLSLGMMTAFSNFAKTGNPNLPVDFKQYLNATWPSYDRMTKYYLEISFNVTPTSVKQHFSARAMRFWSKLIPEIVREAA